MAGNATGAGGTGVLTLRNVTAIAFDKDSEVVKSVNSYTLKDGKVIAFNGRETPTRGRLDLLITKGFSL